ncbi:methyltransferase domain-containing protein [Candidatus Woesearchaeota archaeon]|nr:methyltransferase domain-containing protein [Candidatus Woesearchaeota archaeon]
MKDFSGKENYRDFGNLKTRKNFYSKYCNPLINSKEEVFKLLNIKGNEKILDVGCGNGDFLAYIEDKGCSGEMIGVDISKGMIEEAKKLNIDKPISFITANAEDLPFINECFDIVVCKHILYHLNSIEKGINEIYRVLKNGGYLCVTLNCMYGRENIENFKRIIANSIKNNNFLDNNKRINFENYNSFISGFNILREIKLHRYLELEDPEPIVEYLNSFRGFWQPLPPDEAWYKALKIIKEEIIKIIQKEEKFKADLAFGMILLQKI